MFGFKCLYIFFIICLVELSYLCYLTSSFEAGEEPQDFFLLNRGFLSITSEFGCISNGSKMTTSHKVILFDSVRLYGSDRLAYTNEIYYDV